MFKNGISSWLSSVSTMDAVMSKSKPVTSRNYLVHLSLRVWEILSVIM